MKLLIFVTVLMHVGLAATSAQRKSASPKPREREVSLKQLDDDSHRYGRWVRVRGVNLEECIGYEGDWATVLRLHEPSSGTRTGPPDARFAAITDQSLARSLRAHRSYWRYAATLYLELGDWGFSPQHYSGRAWRVDFHDEQGLLVLSLESSRRGPPN